MLDCLPCAAIRDAIDFCGAWSSCLPGQKTTPPPKRKRPPTTPPLGGGQQGYIIPPPPTQYISISCAPCEDGHIPALPDCDCTVNTLGPCGCGDNYCQCQFNACNASCGGGIGGATCTVDCAIQANKCMNNPPPCPQPVSSGQPRTIIVPGPPPCMSPEHDAPCADGECWDQLTGCCAACGSTVILGPPSLGYGETGWSDVSSRLASPSLGL